MRSCLIIVLLTVVFAASSCATTIPVRVSLPLPPSLSVPENIIEEMECDGEGAFPSESALWFCLLRERINTLTDIIETSHD